MHGFKASLELLHKVGVASTAKYLEELTDYLCAGLQSKEYEIVSSRARGEKSQIVCLEPYRNWTAMGLYAHLRKKNIITAPRLDYLRIAPHLYNTPAEMDELIKALP